MRYISRAGLALLMICALLLFPAAKAEAAGAYSAHLTLNLDGQPVQAKCYLDLENGAVSLQLPTQEQGGLGVFLSADAVAVQTGPGAVYGIDWNTMTQKLPDSVFAPDAGSALALEQELYDLLMERGTTEESSVGVIGGADGPTSIFLAGDLSSLAGLISNADLKVSLGKLQTESGDIRTLETTVQLDAQGIASLAEQLLTQAQDSPDVQNILTMLLGALVSADALPEDWSEKSGEELARELLSETGRAAASLEDTLTQANARLALSAAVDWKTRQTVSAAVVWSYDGTVSSARAVFAGGTYSATLDWGGGKPLTAVLTLDENTDRALELTFYVTQEETSDSQLRFRWDKEAGTFVFTAQNGDEVDELTGTVQTDGDSVTVTPLRANGQTLEGTSLTLRRNDPVNIPEFRDILTMSEEEILELLQDTLEWIQ